MTQVQTKDQDALQKQTSQQHHQKAAAHHDEASKHHKEAGKCCESDDPKSAAHHAQIAQGHTTQAAEQGAEASKKYAKTHSAKN
jgi:hypothetical protein